MEARSFHAWDIVISTLKPSFSTSPVISILFPALSRDPLFRPQITFTAHHNKNVGRRNFFSHRPFSFYFSVNQLGLNRKTAAKYGSLGIGEIRLGEIWKAIVANAFFSCKTIFLLFGQLNKKTFGRLWPQVSWRTDEKKGSKESLIIFLHRVALLICPLINFGDSSLQNKCSLCSLLSFTLLSLCLTLTLPLFHSHSLISDGCTEYDLTEILLPEDILMFITLLISGS